MKSLVTLLAILSFSVMAGCSSTDNRYEKEYQKESAEKSHQELSREADKLNK